MFSLNRNFKYVIFGLVALAGLAGAYLWYHNTYRPLREEIRSVEVRRDRLQQRTQMARASIGRARASSPADIAQRIQASNQQAMYIARLVPVDTVRDDFQERINLAANSNRVQILNQQAVREEREGAYVTRGFSFLVRGAYHDVGAFLTDVLSMGGITHVREPVLRAVRLSGEGESEEWGVEVAVTLRAFYTPSRPLPELGDSASVSVETTSGTQ